MSIAFLSSQIREDARAQSMLALQRLYVPVCGCGRVENEGRGQSPLCGWGHRIRVFAVLGVVFSRPWSSGLLGAERGRWVVVVVVVGVLKCGFPGYAPSALSVSLSKRGSQGNGSREYSSSPSFLLPPLLQLWHNLSELRSDVSPSNRIPPFSAFSTLLHNCPPIRPTIHLASIQSIVARKHSGHSRMLE